MVSVAAPAGGRLGPRWARSVRERPAPFAMLTALSALAVVVSVLLPLLIRSVAGVSFAQTLAAGDLVHSGFVVTAQSPAGQSIGGAKSVADGVTGAVSDSSAWTAAETRTVSAVSQYWLTGASAKTDSYVAVVAACAGLTLTSGRCPTGAGQVAIPASIAAGLHGSFLSTLTFYAANEPHLTVVGVYDDRRGGGLALAQPSSFDPAVSRATSSALLIGPQSTPKLGFGFEVIEERRVRDPAHLDDESALLADVRAAQAAAQNAAGARFSTHISTSLPGVFARLDGERRAATVLGAAIAVEALALSWFAMAVVIGRISRTRAVEWGIGRTRGVARGRWLGSIFVEPGIAVLVGAVAGFALGAGLAASVMALVSPGVAAVDPWQPIVPVAALLAVGGSLATLAAASIRSARLPLPDLLRTTTEPRRLSRLALVAQVGAVLVTAVVVWDVLGQQRIDSGQVALLAPTLVALTIALAALRLAVILVRRRTTAPSRSIGGLVIGRQLARAPSALSGAVLVAIGVALAAYTLQLAAVNLRVAGDQAGAELGAGAVATVALDPGTDLRTAVEGADPSGRQAMAVEELNAGPGTSHVVAVDTARLNAVATWPSAWRGTAASIRALDPAIGTDLMLRGSQLHVRLADVRDGMQSHTGLHLRVVVASRTAWTTVDLGLVRNGGLTGAIPCSNGCRLVSIGSSASDPFPSGVAFTLAGIGTDQQADSVAAAWLDGRDHWRSRVVDQTNPALPAQATAQAGSGGLEVDLEDRAGDLTPSLEPAVGPDLLPALAGPSTDLTSFDGLPGATFGIGLDRGSLLLDVLGRVAVLPRALGDGVLVDLAQIERRSDPAASSPTDEVWFPAAPRSALVQRLAAHGVHVASIRTLAAERTAGLRTADRRTLALAPVVAGVALLLTFLALLGCRIASAPAKTRDWRTLRTAGFRRSRIVRLAALDTAAPSAIAVLLGLAAGLAGFALTIGRLPLFPDGVAHPPLDTAVAVLPLALLAVVSLACVAGISVGAARVETRSLRA